MPFGSPMTALSGSSSTSSPPLTQRVRQKLQASTPKKSGPPNSSTAQSRPTVPALNLITDFPSSDEAPTISKPGHKRQESIQDRRKRARKEGSKGRVEIVKGTDQRVSGLSPSDRTLVIGIALQPEKVGAQREGLITSNAGNHEGVTPEIVITPAALENPWNLPDSKYRPRSSVYSQATQHARGVSQFGNIPLTANAPPVPPIPSNTLLPGTKIARPTSAASWHTDFSEDEERNALRRRYSGESQLGILRTNSVDTTATRHRSKGWWNTLLSPLLDRQNTMGRKSTKTADRNISGAAEKGRTKAATTPVVEASEKQSSALDSARTPVTPWEENRQTLAFFHDSPTDLKQHPDWQRAEPAPSPEFVSEKGFGEAAEYFEACWHDLHSPTPFFECQNHTCRRLWYYRHGPAIGGPDAAYEAEQRALANASQTQHAEKSRGVDGGNDKQLAVSPSEASRALDSPAVTHASKSPKSPHVRNVSESTEIDEEPDAASEILNTRSLPNSKAASPIPQSEELTKDRGLELNEPGKPSQPAIEESRVTQPVTADLSKATPSKSTVPDFKAPPSSPLRAAVAPSPPALTPGLQREFTNHNAIPMQSAPTAQRSIATPAVDLFQISEPRAAPQPPQPRALESNIADHRVPPATAWSPLGDNRNEPRSGLGINTVDTPAGASPVSAFTSHYEQSHAYTRDRSVSRDRQATPVFEPPPRARPNAVTRIVPSENVKSVEEKGTKDHSKSWKLTGCFPKAKTKEDKRKRRCCFFIFGALLAMVILIVVLVLTLTIPRNDIPIQESWLNISGFPPIPTGVATIAQPSAAVEFSGCVAPTTMWSCAVPKEQQQSIAPNQPDQPNFRIAIRFQNGSAAINSSNSTASKRSIEPYNPASAGQFIRSQKVRARDSFTNSLFTPNPAPPSQDDQDFLGNTTDNTTTPFAGEATPFFISFLPTQASTSDIKRRQDGLDINATDPFPNISIAIPPPSVNPDGTAAAANLYPFPSAQPLKLYNRGRSDEHYGFFTYFDRSIFLRSQDLLNSTSEPNVPGDEDGGSPESAANVRCTWKQTRFLVQIWTNAGSAVQLLSTSNSTNSSTAPVPTSNSADDFARPGSFPYPVSITLDRHGGDIENKMIYCYGMDEQERIVSSQKQIHIENRSAGGPGLINPSQGIFAQTNVSTAQGGPGSIDGGVGGCRCLWQNWQLTS